MKAFRVLTTIAGVALIAEASGYAQTSAPPLLTAVRSGADIMISWPTNALGFTLQSALNPIPLGDWSDSTNTPFIVGTEFTITNSAAESRQFFRLKRNSIVLLAEDFNAGDGGFTIVTPIPYEGPWVYSAGSGSWRQDGQGPENQHLNTSLLISPSINVSRAGVVGLIFAHRYSFEFDQGGWDGGQIRISVNGGVFTPVSSSAFSQNGYSGTVLANSQSELHGQYAFVWDSPNYAGGFITSECALGVFQTGDNIRVQFIAASDSNTRGSFLPNWEIDSFQVVSLP